MSKDKGSLLFTMVVPSVRLICFKIERYILQFPGQLTKGYYQHHNKNVSLEKTMGEEFLTMQFDAIDSVP